MNTQHEVTRSTILATRGLVSLFTDLVGDHYGTARFADGICKMIVEHDPGEGRNVARITARVVDGGLRLAPYGGGAIFDEEQAKLARLVQGIFDDV